MERSFKSHILIINLIFLVLFSTISIAQAQDSIKVQIGDKMDYKIDELLVNGNNNLTIPFFVPDSLPPYYTSKNFTFNQGMAFQVDICSIENGTIVWNFNFNGQKTLTDMSGIQKLNKNQIDELKNGTCFPNLDYSTGFYSFVQSVQNKSYYQNEASVSPSDQITLDGNIFTYPTNSGTGTIQSESINKIDITTGWTTYYQYRQWNNTDNSTLQEIEISMANSNSSCYLTSRTTSATSPFPLSIFLVSLVLVYVMKKKKKLLDLKSKYSFIILFLHVF